MTLEGPTTGPAVAPGPTDTAVVVVNYRTWELTRAAVESVLPEPEVLEVVVVDNASGDGSPSLLRTSLADPRVRIIESGRNSGFGCGVNIGVANSSASLVFILNSDAIACPGSLGLLATAMMADATAGIISPSVYLGDGRRLQQATFGALPTRHELLLGRWKVNGERGPSAGDTRPEWVSGVAMLIRRTDFCAVGGFDEAFDMYFEDLDLCRRVRATGKGIRRIPEAGVVHRVGESSRSKHDQKRRFHASKQVYAQRLGATPAELRWISLTGGIETGLAGVRQRFAKRTAAPPPPTPRGAEGLW